MCSVCTRNVNEELLMKFTKFLDSKHRSYRRKLSIIENVLKAFNIKVESYLNQSDSYLYVPADVDGLSFNGIRIYGIGDIIAFRVQNESTSHPYGKSYEIKIEELFNTLISEDMDSTKAGKEVAKYIKEELISFVKTSVKAEEESAGMTKDDGFGKIIVNPYGIDYATSIFNKM